MKINPSTYHSWQIKLLQSQMEFHNRKLLTEMNIDGTESSTESLISNEFTLAVNQKISETFDTYEAKLTPYLKKYLGLPSNKKINNLDENLKKFLSAYITFYDLPKAVFKGCIENPLSLLLELENFNLNVMSVSKIESLIS